jgi:hypothetical protein
MTEYHSNNHKAIIWRTILANSNAKLDDIQTALHNANKTMSNATAAELAAEFRQVLKFLTGEGLITARKQTSTSKAHRSPSTERRAILHALDRAKRPLGPNALALATRMKSNNVRFLLHVMAKDGDVERVAHGKYQRQVVVDDGKGEDYSRKRRSFREWSFSG